MKILINGAGVAGPTLAFWLDRAGFEVTLVERAAHFRTGGYVIDFWGLGYTIAERMGVIKDIRARGYQVDEVRFVGDDGGRQSGFSVAKLDRLTGGRFTSLPRGDLAECLYSAISGRIETIFGDRVVAMDDRADGVGVTFGSGGFREVDLVIGADGLHSGIRELAFGPERQFERDLGYCVAAFTAPTYAPRDPDTYVTHSLPGRSISRFALRDGSTLFLFVFTSDNLPEGPPQADAERRAALRRIFGDAGWESAAILSALDGADDLYLDRVSQIEMPAWSKGRIALIGDAAACVSLLAGEGTGLGMTEAYVLAAALAEAGGNHREAFARYEQQLRDFLAAKQKSARDFASSFAPRTKLGLFVRDLVVRSMKIPLVADLALGGSVRDDFVLPDFPPRPSG